MQAGIALPAPADVDHVAIGVRRHPAQVAGVPVPEFLNAHYRHPCAGSQHRDQVADGGDRPLGGIGDWGGIDGGFSLA